MPCVVPFHKKKPHQDLVSKMETWINSVAMKKQLATTMGGRNKNAQNRDQHQSNNGDADRNSPEMQTHFFQMKNDSNDNQQHGGFCLIFAVMQKIEKDLEQLGFKVNQHGVCVTNDMRNGKPTNSCVTCG